MEKEEETVAASILTTSIIINNDIQFKYVYVATSG